MLLNGLQKSFVWTKTDWSDVLIRVVRHRYESATVEMDLVWYRLLHVFIAPPQLHDFSPGPVLQFSLASLFAARIIEIALHRIPHTEPQGMRRERRKRRWSLVRRKRRRSSVRRKRRRRRPAIFRPNLRLLFLLSRVLRHDLRGLFSPHRCHSLLRHFPLGRPGFCLHCRFSFLFLSPVVFSFFCCFFVRFPLQLLLQLSGSLCLLSLVRDFRFLSLHNRGLNQTIQRRPFLLNFLLPDTSCGPFQHSGGQSFSSPLHLTQLQPT